MYDRTLIQIRERSFLDLFDLALVLLRNRPVTLGLAALCGVAPFAVLNVWVLWDASLPRTLWVALLFLEAPWATAPLTVVLGDLMFGLKISARRTARRLLFAFPTLFWTQFLVRALLFVSIVGWPLLVSRAAFLDEVILLERVYGIRAPRRVHALTHGYEGELILRSIGQVALLLLFALSFSWGAGTIVSTLVGDDLSWYHPGLSDVRGRLFEGAVWVAIVHLGVVRFLTYIDRRIRLEGWELELRLKAAGAALEARST
jgi:hypothetical protein